MREVFFITISVLLTRSVLGENISEDISSEKDLTQEDILHVNTNDFLAEAAVINETLVASRPELSVTSDYENPEMKNIRESSREAAINGEKYISLDSYSFHITGLHPQMTDIEFSDWYFLFLTPTFTYTDKTDHNDLGPSDPPSPSHLATTSTNKLTLTALKSTSKEVAESLSEKLSVPASEFSIISIEEYQSGSLSVNLSLTSHRIPGLHHHLVTLPSSPSPANILRINNKLYRLGQVFHDKNQHLYINNDQSSVSTFESVGLFITLSLGGLGMFLVVLSVTFVFAKMITKPTEFERLGDSVEVVDPEDDYEDVNLPLTDNKEIFVIENLEVEEDNTRRNIGEMKYGPQDREPTRNVLSQLWTALVTGGGTFKENVFGEKFIELKP